MPVPLIPLLGSVGASLLGSALSNKGTRKSQERANKHNINFWNMQNEYNSPTAQMKRLREAGLNPNLIYGSGGGSTGVADKIAPSKPAPYNIENPLSDITQFADVKVKEAQTNNLETQNTVLKQDGLLKASQTTGNLIRNANTKLEYKMAKELYNTTADGVREELRQSELKTIDAIINTTVKSQSAQDMVKKIMYETKFAVEQYKGQKKLNTLRQLEINLNALGIQKSDNLIFRIFGQSWEDLKKYSKEQSSKTFWD